MLYTLRGRIDTSSHRILFVDGRLAGSSCLVGCAGVEPAWTSWQPWFETAVALLFSSWMNHIEQKHHSTLSLDSCPGTMCKILQSNTRASYDPQLGDVSRKKKVAPPNRHVCEGEIKLLHIIGKQLWHVKHLIIRGCLKALTSLIWRDLNPVYLLAEYVKRFY